MSKLFKLPKKFVMPNDVISRTIPGKIVANQPLKMIVKSSAAGEKEKYRNVLMTSPNSGTDEFTIFDKCVNDACCSLYHEGIMAFTPATIGRILNGLSGGADVSKTMQDRIAESIRKQNQLFLYIYPGNARVIGTTSNMTMEDGGNILAVSESLEKCGGFDVVVFELDEEPFLLKYCHNKKLVITIDRDIWDTSNFLRNSDRVMYLKRYLLSAIYLMKNSKYQNKELLYRTILEKSGVALTGQYKRDKQNIMRILDSFQAAGYIQGYTVIGEKIQFQC